MKRCARRQRPQVRKWRQPGPRIGTWKTWNRQVSQGRLKGEAKPPRTPGSTVNQGGEACVSVPPWIRAGACAPNSPAPGPTLPTLPGPQRQKAGGPQGV